MTRLRRTTRVGFLPGALLAAGDLAADRDAEAVRRGLHVRLVHDTWGIALGLDVALRGGGRSAEVTPGLAYGRDGRELWVDAPVTVLVPASGARPAMVLTLAPGEDRAECPDGAAARPALRWRDLRCVPCDEVPLALVTLARGVAIALDPGVRRTTRGLPARVAAGVQEVDVPLAGLLLTQVAVDATAAGLGGSPRWFATLADRSPNGLAALPARVWSWLRGPWLDVRDETATGFALDIRFAVREDAFAIGLLDGGAHGDLELAVHWVGVATPDRPLGGTP